MHFLNHGVCPSCHKFCGCSKNPTTMGDYCDYHRPGSTKDPVEEKHKAKDVHWRSAMKVEKARRRKLAKREDAKFEHRCADYHYAFIAGINFALRTQK